LIYGLEDLLHTGCMANNTTAKIKKRQMSLLIGIGLEYDDA